jgi:ribosome maturation factor RimP
LQSTISASDILVSSSISTIDIHYLEFIEMFSGKLIFLTLSLLGTESNAFSIRPQSIRAISTPSSALHSTKSERPRSRVSDPSGSTPSLEDHEMETVNVEDIPEMQYDEDNHPIPHQPWRRGETAGCEDPIDAEWRQKAEEIMRKSVEMVGGTLIDITWYLTQVIVTIDDDWERIPRDFLKSNGPVIEVVSPQSPMFKDPSDPNPEDIWAGEDDIVYQRDDEAEEEIRSKMYARQEEGEEDLGIDDDEDVPLYVREETREDDALRIQEEMQLQEEQRERRVTKETLKVDTAALSNIAGAMLDALETVEDELHVLERHEIVLASRGEPDVLETQKQFDAHRGDDVAVETEDPWESNRTLRGKLVDRNSMDVIINQQGRMVTIPLNFVKCVRLKYGKSDQGNELLNDEDIYEYEE